ncbi:MAG TPA: Lrp/AsnC family transcriptional regulator [Gammaproteobacteria bacterium]|nr:Lrp/AsnC family transcriptional regulator [Gammaproteobacteria bacterium]
MRFISGPPIGQFTGKSHITLATIYGGKVKLDRERAGLGLTVFIAVKLKSHGDSAAMAFRRSMSGMAEVIACYITSGRHDFLLHVVVPDLAEYRRFVLDRLIKLPDVRDINSSFVIDTVKEDAPIPLNHLK